MSLSVHARMFLAWLVTRHFTFLFGDMRCKIEGLINCSRAIYLLPSWSEIKTCFSSSNRGLYIYIWMCQEESKSCSSFFMTCRFVRCGVLLKGTKLTQFYNLIYFPVIRSGSSSVTALTWMSCFIEAAHRHVSLWLFSIDIDVVAGGGDTESTRIYAVLTSLRWWVLLTATAKKTLERFTSRLAKK